MSNLEKKRGTTGIRAPLVTLAGAAMLAGVSTAHAWEVKSHYPTGISPALPDAHEAQRLADQPPTLLNAIRQAHRQSLQYSWKGVVAPSPHPSFVAAPAAAADTSSLSR